MKCKDVRVDISPYISGELTPQLEKEIDKHLLTCEDCKFEYKMIKNMGELFKAEQKNVKMPNTLEQKLRKKVIKPRMNKILKLSSLIAAILIFSIITTATISPAFAQFISNIPGVYQILDWLNSPSLERAIKHDMMQPIDEVQEVDGLRIHFEGFIADDSNIVIFYNIKNISNKSIESVQVLSNGITINGEQVLTGSESPSTGKLGKGTKERSAIYLTLPPDSWRKGGEKNSLTVNTGIFSGDINNITNIEPLTFEVYLEKFTDINQTIDIDKEIEIEGQKIHVDQIIIRPTESVIYYKPHQNNTKEVLRADFKLIDDKGNIYLPQGGTYTPREDGYKRQNMESPMFVDYKRLYLTAGDFQAIDKEDLILKIDIDNKKIINGPEDIVLKDVYFLEEGSFLEEGDLDGALMVELYCEEGTRLQWYAKDFQGNALRSIFKSSGSEPMVGRSSRRYYLRECFENTTSRTITIEIINYPNIISEDFKIRIK